MLRALSIRDFVIVSKAELEPGAGFVVLTGETGAGKSILVDAIELLVGGRGDAAVVRPGADRADLSAEFSLPETGPLVEWLGEQELEGDAGSVLLRRVIDVKGRSRAFINGHAVTLAQLRAAGEWLVDIHGQHAHQSLLRTAEQRSVLDGYAQAQSLAAECAQAYAAWQRLTAMAAQAQAEFARNDAQRQLLEEQIADLRGLAMQEDEWARLGDEHRRLSHGSSLLSGAQSALEALEDGDEACLGRLSSATESLRALAKHDRGLEPVVELLDSALVQAAESLRLLRHYAEGVDLDPAALRATETRIEDLHAAARRHRVKPEALPALLSACQAKRDQLSLASDPEALARELAAARTHYDAVAAQLSERRRDAAQALSSAVTESLQHFALGGARFAVTLHELEAPSAGGRESVEFEVASHPSLPLRGLARVASGGELARISLAIQLVLREFAAVGVLVFDEVDAGIGGSVADSVGRALRRLGAERQVLCVTHLPQVAAQGNEHWLVHRSQARGAVRVQVSRLERAQRVEELARMLGGAQITAVTRRHAAELLEA